MRLAVLAVTTCVFVQMAGADSMRGSASTIGMFMESEMGSVRGDTWEISCTPARGTERTAAT